MLFRALSVLAGLLALTIAVPASAATADIVVRGADGKPLANAVVIIDTQRKPAGPIRFPWPYQMVQEDIAFAPYVLVVPQGALVSFPNRDRVRHHVYSASRPKKFDLKLYGRDETRSIAFDKTGAVALGCNIHDAMAAFIYVVDTPYAIKTDGGGHAVIANVPAGGATLRVWHPTIRTPGNEMSQAISIGPGDFSTMITARGR